MSSLFLSPHPVTKSSIKFLALLKSLTQSLSSSAVFYYSKVLWQNCLHLFFLSAFIHSFILQRALVIDCLVSSPKIEVSFSFCLIGKNRNPTQASSYKGRCFEKTHQDVFCHEASYSKSPSEGDPSSRLLTLGTYLAGGDTGGRSSLQGGP